MDSGLRRSHGIDTPVPPALVMAFWISARRSALRPTNATLSPAAARSLAIAAPMPLLAPVTIAALPRHRSMPSINPQTKWTAGISGTAKCGLPRGRLGIFHDQQAFELQAAAVQVVPALKLLHGHPVALGNAPQGIPGLHGIGSWRQGTAVRHARGQSRGGNRTPRMAPRLVFVVGNHH